MTEQPKTFPSIQGRCPACQGETLFIGTGGWITCSLISCPNPSAADELMHGTHDVATLTAQLAVATAEVERLSTGEEPGGSPLAEPTPGQWLWQFNRVTADHRLNVIRALLRDAQRGRDCFFMAHEGRAEEGRKAWVAVTRVRDVIADMEQITGARHWARILRTAVDGEPDTTPDGEPVCSAYQPPTTPEDSGLCARCGMYDYKHHAAPAETERCCVCGGGPVVYHNHREQPFCWPCADCRCNQDVCVRTGINDPAVSESAVRADRLAANLREVLAVFSTTAHERPGGRVLGYLAKAPIHPDDMGRWRAALDQPKEQPDA